jgi:hypothetical protein
MMYNFLTVVFIVSLIAIPSAFADEPEAILEISKIDCQLENKTCTPSISDRNYFDLDIDYFFKEFNVRVNMSEKITDTHIILNNIYLVLSLFSIDYIKSLDLTINVSHFNRQFRTTKGSASGRNIYIWDDVLSNLQLESLSDGFDYLPRPVGSSVFLHELAHVIDFVSLRTNLAHIPVDEMLKQRIRNVSKEHLNNFRDYSYFFIHEPAPSSYGEVSMIENFAESLTAFIYDPFFQCYSPGKTNFFIKRLQLNASILDVIKKRSRFCKSYNLHRKAYRIESRNSMQVFFNNGFEQKDIVTHFKIYPWDVFLFWKVDKIDDLSSNELKRTLRKMNRLIKYE